MIGIISRKVIMDLLDVHRTFIGHQGIQVGDLLEIILRYNEHARVLCVVCPWHRSSSEIHRIFNW